jgi:hypothetical protein
MKNPDSRRMAGRAPRRVGFLGPSIRRFCGLGYDGLRDADCGRRSTCSLRSFAGSYPS